MSRLIHADILLLEDDDAYAADVKDQFGHARDTYELHLYHVTSIEQSLAVCREHDVRVAIIDLSLGADTAGTDAISAIWSFDKKIIFIIHSVSPPESIAEWSARIGVPYTSQFFLQKTGAPSDASKLYELTVRALRSYVPHLPPPLMSVADVVQAINRFAERHPTFRPSGVVGNIHRSQDVMNAVSQWAADRLTRAGYDSTRVAVLMTGSFARLEASAGSDADYFVVFNDMGASADDLEEVTRLAFAMFMDVARWFERYGIPVHDAGAPAKRPEKIVWHTTTLPTWFPVTSMRKAKLGRSTQLELTKQWFLLEGRAIFNAPMADAIRSEVLADFGISSQKTVRDSVAHSSLPESLQLLTEEFEYAYRHRTRDSLRTVKHFFMRLVNLFSLRLWMLRCFLDPKIFEQSPRHLLNELSPLPLARLIEFGEFLERVPVLKKGKTQQCIRSLDAIITAYGDVAPALGADELRTPQPDVHSLALVNDLEDAAKKCGEEIDRVRIILADSAAVASHGQAVRKLI